MLLSYKEKVIWLSYLIAEKSRIESKVRIIESRMVAWLIVIISIIIALKTIHWVVIIPFVYLAYSFWEDVMINIGLKKIKDKYALLTWNFITMKEVNEENIKNEMKVLKEDEKNAEDRRLMKTMKKICIKIRRCIKLFFNVMNGEIV